jgi:5,10-methylenetetrahydromethanopterin reductase
VEFEGITTRFSGQLDFVPSRPEIPIWIAGRGPTVLQLAGEVANGVMVGGLASKPGLDYARRQIERGLARAGRPATSVTRSVWLHTAIADDGHRARNAVRLIVVGAMLSSLNVLEELGIPIPESLIAQLRGVTYGYNNPEMQRVAESLDDEILDHFSVAGTVDEVVPRLRALADSGIEHVAVLPWLAEGQTLEDFIDRLADAMARTS